MGSELKKPIRGPWQIKWDWRLMEQMLAKYPNETEAIKRIGCGVITQSHVRVILGEYKKWKQQSRKKRQKI